ncbi:MAG TPA: class I SAM-dependent rRNA methyltransferase [Phycisphaerae bacterium]|nr:class I SAM-dependent methyltransferase [Phycisphaerales bacterium]HRX86672.1 class I SAM-dependent rRNA methyltransferase [Phycisphaerae bacterium]
MVARTSDSVSAVVARLFPVIWDDAEFMAVAKPPRVNLESAAWPHGPRTIDLVVDHLPKSKWAGEGGGLLPLILPERLSSGIALFARSHEARHRFAGMATSNRLAYTHVAIVRGKPPRKRIAVKSGNEPRSRKAVKGSPATPAATAHVEILATHGDLHVARCTTKSAGLDDVRRLFKAAGGLQIVGDIRPSPYAAERRASPSRRPLVHLAGLQFPHPFKRRNVDIVDPAPKAFEAYLATNLLLEEHLRAALAGRLALVADEDTDTFRLFTGGNEGIGGLVADKLADAVLLETLEGHFDGSELQVRQIANWYQRTLGIRTVYARHVPRRRTGAAPTSAEAHTEVLKGTPKDQITVHENGVRYLARFTEGWSTGLFLDQRDNRRRIAELCDGKDLLNLFAYTCGFSVAAALAGARSTTSVDLSASNLEWGKDNFAANGLALDEHTFVRSDAFDYVKRALRQDKRYDIIVLDPPTFARAKKPRRTFEVKRHLGELIAAAAEVLRPRGHLLISTNYRQMTPAMLRRHVEEGLGDRPHRIVLQPKLPADFAPDADYQKSLLVRVS